MVHIRFLGAARTVTGSKFHVSVGDFAVMVDCGMFQGLKELREQNWRPLSVDVPAVSYILLTHGHLDHVGYLPRMLKQGFKGRVLGTAPTLAITRIILRDSAKIHEEEAEKANKEGYSKHHPALPFYTLEEAEAVMERFDSVPLDEWQELHDDVAVKWTYNGHILGATYLILKIGGKQYVFSGDIGRPDDLLLRDPEYPKWADYLFMESTYGDRTHPEEDVENTLITLAQETIRERGTLLIPSFAVERLQMLMLILWRLYQKNRIPGIPIFIDSPMGTDVLSVFREYKAWHRIPDADLKAMCRHMTLVSSYRDTWKTIDDPRPKIVVAGSGMLSGGRILTYLTRTLEKKNTTILLVGYQAEGTRGRKLLDGEGRIRIFGKEYDVEARVVHLESLSAHADRNELLTWLGNIRNIPEKVFLIHGEQAAMEGLKAGIEEEYGWSVILPSLEETVSLV
ncbi:metallo-beta-lactamase family protein [Muriicola jejuensis]|uniref:MBL fold metallo-hydrolase n=1 Tax=Muriicola jejuensis TaxID=504488 RepID=A0A6P0U9A1_9FLAO|nr:MBL fold metallo-hydrolase [Muriicola jejuensis]NER09100.1 MBL fold metallo-hydrolase [Muriicola jejuensis]SMP11129.1 metallo-beta-lactamase family protein [Muriicola jejuensis]